MLSDPDSFDRERPKKYKQLEEEEEEEEEEDEEREKLGKKAEELEDRIRKRERGRIGEGNKKKNGGLSQGKFKAFFCI